MTTLSSPRFRSCAAGFGLALVVAAATGGSGFAQDARPPPSNAADYVGARACAGCHAKQATEWETSHHALAMTPAGDNTVLGDFNGQEQEISGVKSRFFRRDGAFFVDTEGPDGRRAEYRIEYTFGVRPLQQYLARFPGGRLQALTIAWDSRPKAQGGQRWFSLHPGERIAPGDVLHWTQPAYNWNRMCADCHSTNLRKDFDAPSNSYRTAWSEVNVACEACHGPGSRHVAWAKGEGARDAADKGLIVRLSDPGLFAWQFEPGQAIAKRRSAAPETPLADQCGRCHSRHGRLSPENSFSRTLGDTRRVALLEDGLYFPDGQIRDEVYAYGSFLQSRMHQAGVTCANCHEPHSLKLRAEGNGLCAQCHSAEKFDTPRHHFHAAGSQGAQCVACHMPKRTYMVVHDRGDHSFRVPRPDLSVSIGVPNACTQCHQGRSDSWAAQTVTRWYGAQPRPPHFGEALHAARGGHPNAAAMLARIVADESVPAIARATAMQMMEGASGRAAAAQAVVQGVQDTNDLVRAAAARALRGAPDNLRMPLLGLLLEDPVLDVRIAAVESLGAPPETGVPPGLAEAYRNALTEYLRSLALNDDWPQSHVQRAGMFGRRGEIDKAEAAYREALRIQPQFVPAYVNWANLYQTAGRDAEGEKILRDGLARMSDQPDLHHALGLWLVRRGQREAAIEHFGKAASGQPGNARYAYVYAIALDSQGRTRRAIEVLDAAHNRHPVNGAILVALIEYARKLNDRSIADTFSKKLQALSGGR